MSGWDAYCDSMMAEKTLNGCAIVDFQGNVWAATCDFSVTPEEVRALISTFACPDGARQTGVYVNGHRFLYILSDPSQIQGKKGPTGCSVAKGNKCLLIGTYGEGQFGGNARNTLERMRDHLVNAGF